MSKALTNKSILNNAGISSTGTITPTGEASAIALPAAVAPVIGQGRSKVLYWSDTQVQVYTAAQLVMGGFRFGGNYSKGRAPLVNTGVNGSVLVSTASNLGCETAVKAQNWYGVFACSNAGDSTVTFKLMPFLRVGSVAGSVCTLNYAGYGTNAHSIVAATYAFTATNNLAGVDCLVITELQSTLNRWSGRTTTITANTNTTVTLGTIGTVGAYDFLLPAPPGYTNYCYIGAFVTDATPAVVNIADSGVQVSMLGFTCQDPNFVASGTLTNVQIRFGGYVSPLAMGVVIRDSANVSSASLGDFAGSWSHDASNHTINQMYFYKEGTEGNYPFQITFNCNFSVCQSLWYTTGGSLGPSRGSCTLQTYGYFEP